MNVHAWGFYAVCEDLCECVMMVMMVNKRGLVSAFFCSLCVGGTGFGDR